VEGDGQGSPGVSWVTHTSSPRALPTATAGAQWEARGSATHERPVLRVEDRGAVGYMRSAMVRRISAVTLSRWPWSMLAFP
jgi:hypothetical protein